MSLKYKIDVVAALKEVGYTTYRLRTEKLIGEATMTKLRKGELVSWNNIDTICSLLNCQPGDLILFEKNKIICYFLSNFTLYYIELFFYN